MEALVLLGLVVWASCALWVGVNAESTGRNPWFWFLGTLALGVFALFVYWATNPPREEDRYNDELSFKSFAGYFGITISSIVIGFLSGVILAKIVGGLGNGSIQAHSVYEAISFSGMFLVIILGLFGNTYRRYLSERERPSQKTTEALSWYEPRVIGILVLPLAVHVTSMSQQPIFNSIFIQQSLLGVVLFLAAVCCIIIDVWSFGLGYPLWKLGPLAERLKKSLS